MVDTRTLLQYVCLSAIAISICDAIPLHYSRTRTGKKLILILLDAFRWDYFQIKDLRGFQRLMRNGVKARYMTPDFPSESYPNHYSITTGLHVESHGMTGNNMYDPITNDTFRMGYGPNDSHSEWWNGGEPVWVTGKKHGKKSYMYYWLGCEVDIRGYKPDFCDMYSSEKSVMKNLKSIIDKGIKNIIVDDADLIGLYLEAPDYFGHRYGPFSETMNKTVLEIDRHIDYLLDQLIQHNLTEEVNVMVMSDHGMTKMDGNRVVNVSHYIDTTEWDRLIDMQRSLWTIVYNRFDIWPKEGKELEVYNKLKNKNPHMQAYLKKDIPVEWYFKHNRRVAPVVVTGEIGWFMVLQNIARRSKFKVFNDTGPLRGGHGFDHKEKDMRAIFLATGPNFKSNQLDLPRLDIVDLYQMMCWVLAIEPAPNNGSWSHAEPYLEFASYEIGSKVGFGLFLGFLLLLIF